MELLLILQGQRMDATKARLPFLDVIHLAEYQRPSDKATLYPMHRIQGGPLNLASNTVGTSIIRSDAHSHRVSVPTYQRRAGKREGGIAEELLK
mgnify:CR=1 FL=1